MADSGKLYAFARARGPCDDDWSESLRESLDDVGVAESVKSLDDDGVEGLFLLVGKLRQFVVPVFEGNLGRVEVEVLNEVIVGVHHLFKKSSAVEGQLLVVFVGGSDAS